MNTNRAATPSNPALSATPTCDNSKTQAATACENPQGMHFHNAPFGCCGTCVPAAQALRNKRSTLYAANRRRTEDGQTK